MTDDATQPADHPHRFTDPAQEAAYQEAVPLFVSPPRSQQRGRVLLITLAVFVASSMLGGSYSIAELGILIGVLLAHELGHALVMLALGSRDVRVFFIPFFGAAASGHRGSVARWKQGVVLLLGPLPGLVAGVVLLTTNPTGLVESLALQLVVINGFNLLPLAPLDGGQLMQLLVFSRRARAELGFQLVAAIGLGVLAYLMSAWVLGVVAAFVLFGLGFRRIMLDVGGQLRELDLPEEPAALDDVQRRRVFSEVWKVMPAQNRPKAPALASWMTMVQEVATRKPAPVGASVGLFAAWLAGVGVAVFAVFLLRIGPAPEWRPVTHAAPAFTVEMPAAADEEAPTPTTAGLLIARLGRGGEYGVTWNALGLMTPELYVEAATDALPGKVDRVLVDEPTRYEAILTVEGSDLPSHVLITAAGGQGYFLMATGHDAAVSERMIRSFRPQ